MLRVEVKSVPTRLEKYNTLVFDNGLRVDRFYSGKSHGKLSFYILSKVTTSGTTTRTWYLEIAPERENRKADGDKKKKPGKQEETTEETTT